MAYYRTGGGGDIEYKLLGDISISSTTAKTLYLNESIKNYKYLLITMYAVQTGDFFVGSGCLMPILFFVTPTYFENNVLSGTWVTGNSGTQTSNTSTFTYVSDTSLKIKNPVATARHFYVYGFK